MKSKYLLKYIIPFFSILLCLSYSCKKPSFDQLLREGFINPPDSAKPGVYWYFMDGNIDKKAITEDLEAMKQAGIGYALFLEVNVGIPRGSVDFMSEEWMELFAHAVREAERLGIKIILGSGPGWAGSGGPWVKPEQSMMHIVAADTVVTGPVLFDAQLPLPAPKKPFFGENTLTPELKELRDNWYEDIRVLAFPAPEKQNKIENLDEKAFYYRAPYTSQPDVEPFILPFDSTKETTEPSVKKDKIIDLTLIYQGNGRLTWNVPPGRWVIIRFVKRNNGAVTRPAPLPGLGFETDKFDTAALGEHFRAFTENLIKKVNKGRKSSSPGWTMLHIDSWEMGAQNWSHRFIDEFIARRGYDPVLYLPVFAGYTVNSSEESERFLWDVRQTASELIVENHAGYFKSLGRKYGFLLSIEPYDMNPASDFDLGAIADIPMGEFWTKGHGFNSSFSCIEATSIGHVTGKPVIAAEAFTADRTEAWKMYPGNMKNQTDWALAMGINRFIFHTFAHKPHGSKYLPGMTMGPYGVHWDRGQTWWPLVSEYHKYLSRCQLMLMQGVSAADILFLTPEGAPNVFVPPASALDGNDTIPDKKGYSFDACSPSYLIKNAFVVNGRVTFPSGASYTLLVLPRLNTMTPELLEKINELLKTGAIVAGWMPVKSPSLAKYPECDKEVKKLSETIWGINWSVGKSQIKYLNGTLFKLEEYIKEPYNPSPDDNYDIYPSYETLVSLMRALGREPDFTCKSGNIRWHHKKLTEKEIYFISNRTDETISDTCYFRDGSDDAELWDPLTGDIRKLKNIFYRGWVTEIPIKLEPYQSFFIVFNKTNAATFRIRTGTENDFPEKKELFSLDRNWSVYFDPSWGGPGEVAFDSISEWTERPEPGIRYYSGTAVYRRSFSMPEGKLNKKANDYFIKINLSNSMAKVKLNGKTAGIIWTSPGELKITDYLKEKENTLEVEVTNLWINRLIGDEEEPWDGIENGKWPEWLIRGEKRPTNRLTFTTHRYYKKGDPLMPSGINSAVKVLYLPRKQDKV